MGALILVVLAVSGVVSVMAGIGIRDRRRARRERKKHERLYHRSLDLLRDARFRYRSMQEVQLIKHLIRKGDFENLVEALEINYRARGIDP